jgi:hypothetical protein
VIIGVKQVQKRSNWAGWVKMIWMEKGRDGWTDKAMEDEVVERNKNLNRGFRKLRVWREAIELYVCTFEVRGDFPKYV